ncbi:MAG: 50S ribosomal protein L17 [Candidatus Omnitrophota bacterium]|nr:MAG: 50S ribosomal protein L17 [Candidatus Omnitrophota bacterium]
MRHRKKSEKFSRPRAQRKALIKSLLRSLVIYERIATTESKAKALRSWADKLITWAKTDTVSNRRLSYRLLENHALVKRLFDNIGPRFKDVGGGYTRVVDFGFRKGDGAKLSFLELTRIERKLKGKKSEEEKEKKIKKEKEAPKKEEKRGIVSGVKKMFRSKKDIQE